MLHGGEDIGNGTSRDERKAFKNRLLDRLSKLFLMRLLTVGLDRTLK